MTENSFSPSITRALHNAGWHPARKLTLDEMSSWFVMHQGHLPLVIFPAAYAILQEFGGLKVNLGEGTDSFTLVFNPPDAMTSWFDYGWMVGQPIFPLATYFPVEHDSNDCQIGIDTTGRIWLSAYDLYFIGQNLQEAIEFLASNAAPPEPIGIQDFERGEEADALRKIVEKTFR